MIAKEINRLLEALNWAHKDLTAKNDNCAAVRKRRHLAPLPNFHEIRKLDEARKDIIRRLEGFRDMHVQADANLDKWEKQV